MNQHINDLLIQKRRSKQHIRRYSQKEQLDHRSKPSLQKSIKFQYYQAARQAECNQKLIQMLRKDFSFVNRKLEAYEDPAIVIQIQENIRKQLQRIHILKQQIAQFKRRNLLNSQKLVVKKKNDFKPYLELKQEYLMYLRKKNNYESKIEKQQQAKVNNVYQGIEVQQKFVTVKDFLDDVKLPEQTKTKHNLTVYNSQKKKLQLIIRKLERDQESHKQKYYATLRQLETVIEVTGGIISRSQKVNQRINLTQIQIFQLRQILKKLQTKHRQNNSSHNQISLITKDQQFAPEKRFQTSQQSGCGFLLTQLESKRDTRKIQRRYQPQNSKSQEKKINNKRFNRKYNQQKILQIEKNKQKKSFEKNDVSKQKQYNYGGQNQVKNDQKSNQQPDQYQNDFQNDQQESSEHIF